MTQERSSQSGWSNSPSSWHVIVTEGVENQSSENTMPDFIILLTFLLSYDTFRKIHLLGS